jgi:hypothetical protein
MMSIIQNGLWRTQNRRRHIQLVKPGMAQKVAPAERQEKGGAPIPSGNQPRPRLVSILNLDFHGASGFAQFPDHLDEIIGYYLRADADRGVVLDLD